MSGSLLLLLVYGSAAVFLAGFIYRALKISSMPLHLRWELAPVPHEKGRNKYGGSYFEEYEWWNKKRGKTQERLFGKQPSSVREFQLRMSRRARRRINKVLKRFQ